MSNEELDAELAKCEAANQRKVAITPCPHCGANGEADAVRRRDVDDRRFTTWGAFWECGTMKLSPSDPIEQSTLCELIVTRTALRDAQRELEQAEQRIALAGGYHQRTEREVEIEQQLEADAQFVEHTGDRTVSYLWLARCHELLTLVDAGRNRIHEEVEKRESAEQRAATLTQQLAEAREREKALRTLINEAENARAFIEGEALSLVDDNHNWFGFTQAIDAARALLAAQPKESADG